jgi:hypothetical protein
MEDLARIILGLNAACDACDLNGEGGIVATPHQIDIDAWRLQNMRAAPYIPYRPIANTPPPQPTRLSQSQKSGYAGNYRGSRFSSREMKHKTFRRQPGDPPAEQGHDGRTPLDQMLANR